MENVVVRITKKDDDSDRFTVLEQVLEEAGFWDKLEKRFVESGKSKKDFLIAVKPNLMMYYKKNDINVITEPALVEHLINKIAAKGYTNIALVESQNVFGNWFENRDVLNVADQAGYNPINYRIVDLTMDVVAHVYKGSLGTYLVGKTWKDADFRISFAKNKTHISCYYTLTIKNIYGTTPEQNKFREYHVDREIDIVTIEMIKEFPVHFGIVDGIWSADGILGLKADYKPNHTKTLIAGENIIAVDIVGGKKMGLDPMKNSFVRLAVETFGKPEIFPHADTTEYKDWKNVGILAPHILDYGEEFYDIANKLGYICSEMDTVAFPKKYEESWFKENVRYIFLNIFRVLNKAGIL
ncbi:hypothetical protein ANME2D_00891 [Candidatus Methanoperedens nitroreducens]|uniref:DUF362 domain-containing protein n=1 Tax=Candidatus Methanoperedens nitratireducens TaxID=1392998 RepID=A0A062V9S8_9EURY|nr:DUF362 domain-containing protein [Candidatus Methanoperedens nitroreducens]KCZ72464.1 hypothetical protein ANME2D_00891 [Candidatus Methanoperedens nitroreducens]MDJ1423602.1 DUF362 domain-containing protein [Candidatus Methanoperedens sp.]